MAELPVHLTYEDALLGLRRAVFEKGRDHKFAPTVPLDSRSYYYFDPESGAAGCIVGHVLSYNGFTKDDLGELNIATGFGSLLRANPRIVTCEPAAKTLLQTAQDEQDSGDTWGSAVDTAVDYVAENADEISGDDLSA